MKTSLDPTQATSQAKARPTKSDFDPATNSGKIGATSSLDHSGPPSGTVPKELDIVSFVFDFQRSDADNENGGLFAGIWDWEVVIGREQPLLSTGLFTYTASSTDVNPPSPVADPPLMGTKNDWVFHFFPNHVPHDLFAFCQGHPSPIEWNFMSWGLEYIFEDAIV